MTQGGYPVEHGGQQSAASQLQPPLTQSDVEGGNVGAHQGGHDGGDGPVEWARLEVEPIAMMLDDGPNVGPQRGHREIDELVGGTDDLPAVVVMFQDRQLARRGTEVEYRQRKRRVGIGHDPALGVVAGGGFAGGDGSDPLQALVLEPVAQAANLATGHTNRVSDDHGESTSVVDPVEPVGQCLDDLLAWRGPAPVVPNNDAVFLNRRDGGPPGPDVDANSCVASSSPHHSSPLRDCSATSILRQRHRDMVSSSQKGNTGAVGLNPTRPNRRSPWDIVFVVAATVATLGLLAWALFA